MIELTSRELSTKRFIYRTGRNIEIKSTFWVRVAGNIGNRDLVLHDTVGIIPGSILLLYPITGSTPPIKLEVKSIAYNTITLRYPLSVIIPKDSLLETTTLTKALFTSPGRDITREQIEMNRRIRVPSDTIIPYGSLISYKSSLYYSTGYQEGDSSLSVGMKLANETIDWYTRIRNLEPLEDETIWPPLIEGEWPEYPDLSLKRSGIPAYQDQMSVFSDIEEPGYIPRLNRLYIVPIWIPIQVGDLIKTEESTMRVLGKDLTKIRNMQALYVNYYKGVDLNG